MIFAKEVTTLAVLTGERVALGVGSSPWPDDYEIVELPWARRGRRFDECIDIIRGLATGDYFEFDGEHYRFPAIKLNPTPAAPIPILIGGHGDANLRRAARIGDGWISAGMSDEQLTTTLARLRELRRRARSRRRAVRDPRHHDRLVHGRRHQAAGRSGRHAHDGRLQRANPYSREPDTEPLQAKLDALRAYADNVIAKVR